MKVLKVNTSSIFNKLQPIRSSRDIYMFVRFGCHRSKITPQGYDHVQGALAKRSQELPFMMNLITKSKGEEISAAIKIVDEKGEHADKKAEEEEAARKAEEEAKPKESGNFMVEGWSQMTGTFTMP